MMHGVMAKRSNTWLSDTKHLSVREQSEEEPSMDENQVDVITKSLQERDGFQDVVDWDRDRDWNSREAILNRPLDVTASAVSFCAELFKEVQKGMPRKGNKKFTTSMLTFDIRGEILTQIMDAEAMCPKVLTGSLGAADPNATEFAKKAVKVAQLDGEEHDFGRLSNVPWRKSLHRVCHDECHALVEGIKKKAKQMQKDFSELVTIGSSQKSQSVEEICADQVVREVESEIMTCCASSCGWNNHSCMFWPLMTSKEQADWESECCTEMNILKGSTRERLCDSTLSKHDKEMSNAIIDNRSNTAKDREILGQDGDVSVASSFMETSSMGSFNGQCPPPLNLDQLHANWTTDWTVMDLDDLKSPPGTRPKNRVSTCAMKKDSQPTINGCKVFLLLQAKTAETNSEEKQRTYDYKCLDDCHMQEPENVSAIMDKESSSSNGIVYIHKDTKWKFPKSTS